MITEEGQEHLFNSISYDIRTELETHLSEEVAKKLLDKIMKRITRNFTEKVDELGYNDLLAAYCKGERTDRISILEKPVFDGQIFCGAGGDTPERNHTGQQIALLYYKIDHAICCLSGLQQNGGMGTKYDKQYEKTAEAEIDRTVRDVAMALAGKRIKFVERLKV